MRKFLIIIVVLFSTFAWAETLKFSHGQVHFKAEKTANRIVFEDSLGERILNIKACNKSMIENFWKRLKNATTKYEKDRDKKVSTRKARNLKFLLKAREQSLGLQMRSAQVCKD